MSISGVGGPQGPQNNQSIQSLRKADVASEYHSIFDKFDTNKDAELNEKDGNNNVIANFWNAVQNFINANKTEKTATPEDVQGATNVDGTNASQTTSIGGEYSLENTVSGLKTEFGPNGEKITSYTDSNGEAITATEEGDKTTISTESSGGVAVSGNFIVLTQPDGTQGVYDRSKGQFLPEDEAKKIIAEMS